MRAFRRDRPEPDGFLRPYRIGAVVLAVFGVLCLLVVVQSPSVVYWTGQRVRGTDEGGIVYYTVAGEERSLDSHRPAPPRPVARTVYADPADSSRDRLLTPVKWLDAAFVVLPFGGAGTTLAVGIARHRRWRGRMAADEQGRRQRATEAWHADGRPGPSPGVTPGDGSRPSRSTRSRRWSR
ncbi:hypothetical protein [Microlunatus flavus]|uniref:DUF3592 domain-containing protein n=1 Tax=Microlunatus flavus TaxID=1036181 RepID=A0A1H9L5H2_9ACTN|nr:hypothetical protein [Microlunatus flavus]SER06263.1 hypothetical protein SAMN05421756_108148 [Microlunatus flavus]